MPLPERKLHLLSNSIIEVEEEIKGLYRRKSEGCHTEISWNS